MSKEIQELATEANTNAGYFRNAGTAFGILVTLAGLVMVIAGLIPVCKDGSSDCYNQGIYNFIPLAIPGISILLTGLVVGYGTAALANYISLKTLIIREQNQD